LRIFAAPSPVFVREFSVVSYNVENLIDSDGVAA
jgi:hypothetical protein